MDWQLPKTVVQQKEQCPLSARWQSVAGMLQSIMKAAFILLSGGRWRLGQFAPVMMKWGAFLPTFCNLILDFLGVHWGGVIGHFPKADTIHLCTLAGLRWQINRSPIYPSAWLCKWGRWQKILYFPHHDYIWHTDFKLLKSKFSLIMFTVK